MFDSPHTIFKAVSESLETPIPENPSDETSIPPIDGEVRKSKTCLFQAHLDDGVTWSIYEESV